MNPIKLLSLVLCVTVISLGSVRTLGGCCLDAKKAGKACDHPCCIAAAKARKSCEKCNPKNPKKQPKEEKKQDRK